jgi:hypothetical protein
VAPHLAGLAHWRPWWKGPALSVLLDRAGADNALQIVVTFVPSATAAEVKREIIKTVQEEVALA